MACAILERISGLEPSSETTALRCLKLTQLLPFYLDLLLDVIATVCHQFGILSTVLHLILCAGFVDFQLRILVLAPSHLEYLCNRRIADW